MKRKPNAKKVELGRKSWDSELQTAKMCSRFIVHTCKRAFSVLKTNFLRVVLILTSPREVDCVTR